VDHLHTQVLTLLAGAHNRALQNLSLTLTPPLNPTCVPQVQTLMAHNRSLQRKMGELAHAVAALPPCDGPKHTDNAPETA